MITFETVTIFVDNKKGKTLYFLYLHKRKGTNLFLYDLLCRVMPPWNLSFLQAWESGPTRPMPCGVCRLSHCVVRGPVDCSAGPRRHSPFDTSAHQTTAHRKLSKSRFFLVIFLSFLPFPFPFSPSQASFFPIQTLKTTCLGRLRDQPSFFN